MKIPFLFGIHCHQPVENFYNVVDWAIEECYAPFLEVAKKHKKFKFSAHYSGWLLEYIRTHRQDVFNNLKQINDEGRVEFFGGGFYEPILSAIPSEDRRGQVKMLSDYIKNYFGQDVNGIWLTERVWDPAIIPDIAQVGIENIIVDDYHLIAAGFPRESITGYFKTEQDGYAVNIIPIDMGLRYLIPFKPQSEVVEHILKAKSKNVKLISCFDDGEKFGLWPNTNEWVYKNKWLAGFIQAISDEKEIEFSFYKDALKSIRPAGVAYLPITSYEEMGEWSLFSDRAERFEEMKEALKSQYSDNDIEQFLKGSIWKNFFVKYPESNRLHKRITDLSVRSRSFKEDAMHKDFLDLLYRSECNDSLWHGVFGGLYLPNLRNNAWKPLILAEAMYEKIANKQVPSIEQYDIDRDGYDEAYYRGKNMNLLFVSRDFGQLATIELKKEGFNLLNVISRKKEAYHKKMLENIKVEEKPAEPTAEGDSIATIHNAEISISPEMADKIAYDWYNKNCFVDHFADTCELSAFSKCAFHEFSDFTNQSADSLEVKDSKIIFKREGGLYYDDKCNKLKMKKEYSISEDTVSLNLTAESAEQFNCNYVNELNFHFANVEDITINNKPYEEKGETSGKEFVIFDKYLNKSIKIKADKDVNFIWYTIYTVSQSEMGVDLTVQGLTVALSTPFEKKISLKVALSIG